MPDLQKFLWDHFFIPLAKVIWPDAGFGYIAICLAMGLILTAIVAYLIGSIPFGLLLTRGAGKGDIRAIGSGNIGATNVLRTGDKKLAALTLLLDMGKGALAVWLGMQIGGGTIVPGICVVLGHMFPVWLHFRGGKGVATAIGVFLAVSITLGLLVIATWLIVFALSRISSLSALIAFFLSPLFAYFALPKLGNIYIDKAGVIFVGIVALAVIVKHHANIRRLVQGKEPRFGSQG